MPEVTVKKLRVAYGDNVVFNDFDICFEDKKINVILGGSGVGKSTLLNAIAGLVEYDGDIETGGSAISYIFQKDRLIPSISVYKNLDLVLRAVFKDKPDRKRRICDMLELLEISHLSGKLPSALSGGEIQRVAMARAYLYPSEILLLDEPFKALDIALKSKLIKEFIKLYEAQKRTVIFVTHAIDECLLLADKYFVFDGNPVSIKHEGEINIEKNDRSLDDAELAPVREELLKCLLCQTN